MMRVGKETGVRKHERARVGERLRLGFLLTLVILAVEVVGGLVAHSLAVFSDAGHMLTDVAALGLAWFAAWQAQKPANARWTYGYHRVGILTALANGATLLLIAAVISFEAYHRLMNPEPVRPDVMILTGAVAVALNLLIVYILRAPGENLNSRAALLHVVGDVGASLAVIVGAGAIWLTGATWVDPVISALIAVVIAVSAIRIIGQTVTILLDTAPAGVSTADLARDMRMVEGVHAVHDLHVWSITSGVRALSAHVIIDDVPPSQSAHLLEEMQSMLRANYQIAHTTLQFECASHDGHETPCERLPGTDGDLHCDPLAGMSETTSAHSHAGHVHA
jgi:cobalt-zinc-cadmium efflux system protein